MDEEVFNPSIGESLPDSDNVYRLALVTDRDKRNKAIPAVRCFSLMPSDKNRLSVEWEKQTTPEECIARVACTYKRNTTIFKSYENREIYSLSINFLKSLSDIEDVIYDPVFFLKPEKGQVNNPAHSLVVFSLDLLSRNANEPEIYLKMRDHAKDRRIAFNMEKVTKLVNEHRAK